MHRKPRELLAAEKPRRSRKRKLQRTKQAKKEAQVEVENHKKQRDKEFKGFEQQYLGTKEDIENEIHRDTEDQINGMKQSVASNKQAVTARLLQLVNIKPELHNNLTLQKKLHGQFAA